MTNSTFEFLGTRSLDYGKGRFDPWDCEGANDFAYFRLSNYVG